MTIKVKVEQPKEDLSWRTLLKLVLKGFKARFYLEPRDIWVGLFWDIRGQDLNIWICVLPMFPIQLVFSLAEIEPCKCGHRHGIYRPSWCRDLVEARTERDALRQLYENPFFVAKVLSKQTEKI